MTLKEAIQLAESCKPIVHNGIEYKRISEVGYKYDENGGSRPFVALLSKGNSVTHANPADVEAKDRKICVICGSFIDGHGHNAMPIKDGICCDSCNYIIVVKARTERKNKEESNGTAK